MAGSMTYLTAHCLKEVQTRMSRNFTYKSTLLIKIHSGKVGFIAREDLAGFWDDPDLQCLVNRGILLSFSCDIDTSELSS